MIQFLPPNASSGPGRCIWWGAAPKPWFQLWGCLWLSDTLCWPLPAMAAPSARQSLYRYCSFKRIQKLEYKIYLLSVFIARENPWHLIIRVPQGAQQCMCRGVVSCVSSSALQLNHLPEGPLYFSQVPTASQHHQSITHWSLKPYCLLLCYFKPFPSFCRYIK